MRKQPGPATPLIGITPDIRTAKPSPSGHKREPVILLQERYARAILDGGGTPVILPITSSLTATRQIMEHLDGIVISGGDFDIHPKYYGEEPIAALGEIKQERTEFEVELIALALKRDFPLFGVCGGAQAINVVLGGSLYQDIATQAPYSMEHQRGDLKEHGGHKVKVHDGTKLKQIVGREQLEVNTTHHQAVKTLGKGLIVNATAEDGIIEGIESPAHAFVLGVQWHPEFLIQRDDFQKKIFASFISVCRGLRQSANLRKN